MDAYDDHNITILPSYTEGYPYVIDESLSRRRPVIIFEEISYVLNNKKGIFISKRDQKSFEETVNFVKYLEARGQSHVTRTCCCVGGEDDKCNGLTP